MVKRETVTEIRWGALDRYQALYLFDRGVRQVDAAYEVAKFNVQNSADAPHDLIRVALTYTRPARMDAR